MEGHDTELAGVGPHGPVRTFNPAPQEIRWDPAAALGHKDGAGIIRACYANGIYLDVLAAHQQHTSARLLNDARTGPGRAYAPAFAHAPDSLIADLRADGKAATRDLPEAGSEHTARPGWPACSHGVYSKGPAKCQPVQDREAV